MPYVNPASSILTSSASSSYSSSSSLSSLSSYSSASGTDSASTTTPVQSPSSSPLTIASATPTQKSATITNSNPSSSFNSSLNSHNRNHNRSYPPHFQQPRHPNQPSNNNINQLQYSSFPMAPANRSNSQSSLTTSSSTSSSTTTTLVTPSKPTPPAGCIFVQPASPMDQPASRPSQAYGHSRSSSSGSIAFSAPSTALSPQTIGLPRSLSSANANYLGLSNTSSNQRPLSHQKAQSESASTSPAAHGHMVRPMIRKKSGEPLRSSLKVAALSPCSSTNSQLPTPPNQTPLPRLDPVQEWNQKLNNASKSAPATPSSGPKFVHFDSHLEHVRHFLSQQRPIAVSRDQSPIETETEGEDEFPFPVMIKMVNPRKSFESASSTSDDPGSSSSHPRLIEFPDLSKSSPSSDLVKLRSLELVKSGREIKGEVKAKNISFEKLVAARFTFDEWRTVSEVTGDYEKSIDAQYDQFVFTIRIQDGVGLGTHKSGNKKQMWLAVKYRTGGQEWWDNNDQANYLISIGSGSGGLQHYHHHHADSRNSAQQHRSHQHSEYSRPFDDLRPKPTALNALAPLSEISPRHARRGSEPTPKRTVSDSPLVSPRMAELREKLNQLVGDDLGISSPQNPSQSSPPSLNALTATTQLKAGGSGLSARYDFGLSLRRAHLVTRPSNDGFPIRKTANKIEDWKPTFPSATNADIEKESARGNGKIGQAALSKANSSGRPVAVKSGSLPPSPPEEPRLATSSGLDASSTPAGEHQAVQLPISPISTSGYRSPHCQSPVTLGFDSARGINHIGIFDQPTTSLGFSSYNNHNHGSSNGTDHHHHQLTLFGSTSASFL